MGCGTPGTAFPTVGICVISPECGGDRWGVPRNGHDRSLHGHVRIRLDTAIICGVSCGTARRPFPTGELHTPSGSQRTVERAQWCYLTTGLTERIVPRHCRGISYAERELANIREGPMVLFDHRPNRTNCPRRLAAKKRCSRSCTVEIYISYWITPAR